MAKRIIVGISGASGIVYGLRALQLLRDCSVQTHLVISKSAKLTLHYELDLPLADLESLASEVHPINHIGAAIASGSFPTAGMLIAPCSVRTMSEIASGRNIDTINQGGGCGTQGASAPRINGARDTAAHGPSAYDDPAVGDGRSDCPSGTRVLHETGDPG